VPKCIKGYESRRIDPDRAEARMRQVERCDLNRLIMEDLRPNLVIRSFNWAIREHVTEHTFGSRCNGSPAIGIVDLANRSRGANKLVCY
jgi:hypothetical protein